MVFEEAGHCLTVDHRGRIYSSLRRGQRCSLATTIVATIPTLYTDNEAADKLSKNQAYHGELGTSNTDGTTYDNK